MADTIKKLSTDATKTAIAATIGLEARVLDLPLTDDGWLRVEVESQPGRKLDCPWQRRGAPVVIDGVTFLIDQPPAPGAAVLLLETDEGNFWAISWWPQ